MVTELWLQNYGYRILSPTIYDDAEKLRFIGILAYPKTKTKSTFFTVQLFLVKSK